jgi:hypothetical protein
MITWMIEHIRYGLAGKWYMVCLGEQGQDIEEGITPAITGNGPTSEVNAQFIAAMRNALPGLLDELTELRRMNQRLREKLFRIYRESTPTDNENETEKPIPPHVCRTTLYRHG